MFNGIIFKTGKLSKIEKKKNSILIGVTTKLKINKNEIGSSICCNGVCLTLEKIKRNLLYFYISNETIKRTNFKNLKKGKEINLEKSLAYGQKISGQFTQGHVDSTATIMKIKILDKSWDLELKLKDKKLSKFLVEKASITINGVSLTISKVKNRYFNLNIIPHTLKLTNLKNLKKNEIVNVELDIFGKYIYKYTT